MCNGLTQNFLVGTSFVALEGMHFIRSYVGVVGFLMAGSGLEELMKVGFGGPKNARQEEFSSKH